MKNILGNAFFAGCLLSSAGTALADVDCGAGGSDCQAIYGQVVQLILDNGDILNSYSGSFPSATATNPYIFVKINGGSNSATSFGACALGTDNAIGFVKFDTDARKAIYANLLTARTTLQDISMVVNVDSSNPICEIAGISFE